LAKQNTEASDIIKPNSPQKRLFLSIVEESAKKIINNSDDRKQFYTLLNSFYDELNSDINKLLQDAFSNAPEDVTSFFFKPYLEAQKFDSAKMKELGQILSGDKKGDKAKAAKDMQNMLKEMSNPRPPAALFFRRSDNLFSEVFFEGTLRQEVDKVMTKITASLKSFYENLTDGEEYNPKEVEGRIQAYYQNTEVFYEVQKQAAKKIGQVYSTRLTPNRQKQILEAVREVLG